MAIQIKFKQRLANLKISLEEFDFFGNTFIKESHPFWIKQYEHSPWYQPKNRNKESFPINRYAVVRHLSQEYWVARDIPKETDFFCIDLDVHETESLYKLYEQIKIIIGIPLVFQSSKSGGLHLYYFLERSFKRKWLAVQLKQVFDNRHITLKPGLIETFPGFNHQHLRLPLGKDSVLLDPSNLSLISQSLQESIQYVKYYKLNHTLFVAQCWDDIYFGAL
jgi:hypothetical protein